MSVACDVSSRKKEKTTSKSSKAVISLLINIVAVIFRLNHRQTDRQTGATGENTQKACRQWRQTDANTVT